MGTFFLPGLSRSHVVDELGRQLSYLRVVRNSNSTGPALQAEYLAWARDARAVLAGLLRPQSVDVLIPPDAVWRVASLTPEPVNRGIIDNLTGVEITERDAAFVSAIAAINADSNHWNSASGRLIVPDTSLFIEHPTKLEAMVLADDLNECEVPLRLVVPMVVIDELDGLKQSRDKHVRWRAGYSLAVIDRVLQQCLGPEELRAEDRTPLEIDGIPRGRVTIEVLLDDPGHVRLPINDDEIVDRALAVQTAAGRDVTLVTYDTGMSMRARAAGLTALKLTQPIDDEPTKA